MDDEDEKNWRAEVGENLRRIHSLLFGAEAAAERGDHSTAQVLGLRLLGFLDSRTVTPLDAAYIAPIRAEVKLKVIAASRALAPESDRQAFEQGKRDIGPIFVSSNDIDIEKITNSKQFLNFLHMTKEYAKNQKISRASANTNVYPSQGCFTDVLQNHLEDQQDRQHEKLTTRASKLMTQMKLTSIYGSSSTNSNKTCYKKQLNSRSCFSTECKEVEDEQENSRNFVNNAHDASIVVQGDEKSHATTLKTKRRHTEFTSPICANIKSPSSCEEANVDAAGNGFVTAKKKLEMDARQRYGVRSSLNPTVSPERENNLTGTSRNYVMRSGGFPRRGFRGNFVPPIKSNGGNSGNTISSRISGKCDDLFDDSTRRCLEILCGPDGELPEKLRNLEPRLIEHVSNEVMDKDPNVRWNDIGATNRPQELDEAARRRLTKRLYIPLPSEARAWIARNLLEKDGLFKLSNEDIVTICKLTEGYSGSDMKNLVKDASMGPLRNALRHGIEITKLKKEDMRPVTLQDFEDALQEVRPSVSVDELGTYEEWNRQFGSLSL